MNVYVSRNMAYKFFAPFGNQKSVRLMQDKNGNLAWFQSAKDFYRISFRIGKFVKKSKQETKGLFREIKYNTPLLYKGELYFYFFYKKSKPSNAWINRPEVITRGQMIKQLFPRQKNLKLKLFAIRRKEKNHKLLNYLWVLYDKEQMIFFINAFQNAPKYRNPEKYAWQEIKLEESFFDMYGRKFFLHTEKEELCIRQLEA